eukprot:SAG31_NODE_9850_length_1220_cov_5.238180_1_plen_215_part_00
MGKCSTCQDKQASYYAPNNGTGRYCKQCAEAVPGAVSRWQRDQSKAREAGNKRTLTGDGPPISLASLGLSPFIAATLKANWLERQLPTGALLTRATRTTWNAATTCALDLTTHTSHEQDAIAIGEQLVGDYAAMAPVLRAVAQQMEINEVAVIGVITSLLLNLQYILSPHPMPCPRWPRRSGHARSTCICIHQQRRRASSTLPGQCSVLGTGRR